MKGNNKIKVGVLYGGTSLEHGVSLASAETVKNNLDQEKYEIIDVFVDKSGQWFIGQEGNREILKKHGDLKNQVDVIVSVLHGSFGEDGQVQRILEDIKVKFIGSGSLSSFLSFSKIISKRIFQNNNIPTPDFIALNNYDLLDLEKLSEKIQEQLGNKVVVKTSESGSSFGVYVCNSSGEIKDSVKNAFEIGNEVFIEQCINGKEYTCGVLEDKNGKIRALPIVEIIPSGEFFDYEAKYENEVQEICPANIEDKVLEKKIKELAIKTHRALGLKGYSRTDFLYNKENGLFILEVNTLPGMTETSLYPQELKADGVGISKFLDKIITRVIKK